MAEGDRLVIRGPRSADALAKRLIARKAEIVGLLAPAAMTRATASTSFDALDIDTPAMATPESMEATPWMKRYLHTYAGTISAGASEIQRNIIAQRVLGLPRR